MYVDALKSALFKDCHKKPSIDLKKKNKTLSSEIR